MIVKIEQGVAVAHGACATALPFVKKICNEFFPRSLSCLNKCLYSLILFATIAYKDFELADTFNVCSFFM